MTARRPALLRFAFLALLVALAALAACAPERRPFVITVPWSDGEMSRYDVLGRDGAARGAASWTWNKTGDGWRESFELTVNGKHERGSVDLDARLRPRSSRGERDGATIELTYDEERITTRKTAPPAAVTEGSLARPADAVDNEASLQVQRGLPFAPGYATAYADVIPKTGAVATIAVTVVGEEPLTVPAGTFAAWHVKMATGPVAQDAWYAKDAPHLLLQYKNTGGGSTFVLRSWRDSAGGEVRGSAGPTPKPPPPAGRPAISVAMLIVSLVVQLPLMLVLPIALGAWLARRFGCGWRPWGAGAAAFVLSQVVHLPLNWAVGLMGSARGLGLLPLPLLALAAGLSAGLCEECARYLMLRYGLKQARSFREAVQLGVGHGGIEAIILGVLAGLGLAVVLALHWIPPGALGIGPDAAAVVTAAVDAYWRAPWYKPALGGLERVFAMTAHVAMSVMVMRAIVRRRVGWLLAAIGAHTALDAFAVWAMSRLGSAWTEVAVGAFGLAFAGLIWAMRDGAPATGQRAR